MSKVIAVGALDAGGVVERVYCAVVARPAWSLPEIAAGLGIAEAEARSAIDRLRALNLVSVSANQPSKFQPVDLDASLRTALAKHEELARSQAELARLAAARLGRVANGGPPTLGMELVLGTDAVSARLAVIVAATSDHLLMLSPGGPGAVPAMDAVWREDEELFARGVAVCVVAPDSARHAPAMVSLVSRGGQARTAAVLPNCMVVADRRATLILLTVSGPGAVVDALHVTDPAIVDVLAALSERVWATASPLDVVPASAGELSQLEHALLAMLAVGLTDEAAAARLGVSQRTARRVMAGLMNRLGARSRFEAGLRCAQRGWL